MVYDIIIVGGGPSGLYCAKRIEEFLGSSNPKILLVEKNRYLGGRTRTVNFHNRRINTGAGVGRYSKDHILRGLVEEIVGKIQYWVSKVCYDFNDPVDTIKVVQELKTHKDLKKIRYELTFKNFFLKNHSESFYKRFCWTNGYTDFENADVIDTLYNYGFDDNVSGTKLFSVPWNKLMYHLKSKLKKTKIQRCRSMLSYSYDNEEGVWNILLESTFSGQRYTVKTKKLVIAGYLNPQLQLEKQIGGNVFLRYYTFEKNRKFSPCLEKGYTEHSRQRYQKRIAISGAIEMTSYSDGKNAESVYRKILSRGRHNCNEAVFYWKTGTHYFKPLDRKWKSRKDFLENAQNPFPNLFVVGEMVSNNQGWTEGAFESVERIINKLVRI